MKHLHRVRSKGRTYWYFRRRGSKPVRLPPPDDPDFEVQYAAALSASAEARRTVTRRGAAQGSVAWWCDQYRELPEWQRLQPDTQRLYARRMMMLCDQYGGHPLRDLTPARVWRVRDTMPGATTAVNGALSMLSLVCGLAVRRGALPSNPCREVRPRPAPGDGHRAWPEEHVEAFQSYWQRGTMPRTVFDLALYTAQRRADLCRMQWTDFADGGLTITQGKTGRALWLPIHADLAETLAEAPRTGPYVIGVQSGAQRSAQGLTSYFRDAVAEAGVPAGYPLHGLRKTAAVRLVEAGCDVDDASAITGHANPAMLRHYAASADQRLRAARAMARVEAKGRLV